MKEDGGEEALRRKMEGGEGKREGGEIKEMKEGRRRERKVSKKEGRKRRKGK